MLRTYLSRLSYLFLFLLPWQTIWVYHEPALNGAKWEYGVLGFYATELLAWVIIALFLFQYLAAVKGGIFLRDKKFGADRFFVLSFLLFVIFLFLSSVWAPVSEIVRQHALRMMLAFLLFILFTSSYISFFRMQFWFIAGSVLPSILGIWQFLSQSTFGSSVFGIAAHKAAEAGTSVVVFADERWLRAYGPMAHPNIFGGYLVFVLWAVYLYVRRRKGKKEHDKKERNIEGGIVLCASILASAALVFTFSRSAWIAFVLLMIGTAFVYMKERISLAIHAAICISAVVCAVLFLPVTMTRITANSAQETRNIEERVSDIAGVRDVFFSSPWLGTGAGNYTARAYELHPYRPAWEYQPVHSVPLLIIAELGLLGASALILFFVSFCLLFIHVLRARRRILVAGVLPAIPLFLFDHYLFSSYIGLVLLAYLFTSYIRSTEH